MNSENDILCIDTVMNDEKGEVRPLCVTVWIISSSSAPGWTAG